MLTQDEERRIRDSVRKSLENILGDSSQGPDESAPVDTPDVGRLSDAERIIAEETERYYRDLGLVKHLTRSGQVFWVTAAEKARLDARRHRRRSRRFLPSFQVNRRVALVWGATILVALLLVVYLLSTQAFGRLMH